MQQVNPVLATDRVSVYTAASLSAFAWSAGTWVYVGQVLWVQLAATIIRTINMAENVFFIFILLCIDNIDLQCNKKHIAKRTE